MSNNKQLVTRIFQEHKHIVNLKSNGEAFKNRKNVLKNDENFTNIVRNVCVELEKTTGIPIIDGQLSNPSVNGIFIASMVNWDKVDKKIMQKIMEIGEPIKTEKTYDILKNLKLEKEINVDEYTWYITDYCWATAEIKTSSLLKSEILGCISYHLEKKDILLEKEASKKYVESVNNWLNKYYINKEIFFDFIEFNIKTTIDIVEYFFRYVFDILQENIDLRTIKNTDEENSLENLVDDLAKDALLATDVISEKIIFKHISNSFKSIYRKSDYIIYNRQKYEIITKNKICEKLGKDIVLNLKIKCDTPTEVELGTDFKIECDSDLFTLDNNIEAGQKLKYKEELELTIKLIPKVQEIIKRKENNHKVTIKLTQKTTNTILAKKTIEIELDPPSFEIKESLPRLPMKGEQFSLEFKVKDSPVDLDIKVKCITNDFEIVYPPLVEQYFSIPVRDCTEDTGKICTGNKLMLLKANRSGSFGFKNSLIFEFSIGEWKEVFKTQVLKMTVLPNFFDLFIVFITLLIGVLSVFYPRLFPSVTDNVDVTSLSSLGGIFYILYRVLLKASGQGPPPGETSSDEEDEK